MNELNKEIPSQTGGDLSFFCFVFLSHGLLCTGTSKAWIGGLGELALKSGDTAAIQYMSMTYSNNQMTSSTTNLTFWTCPGTAILYAYRNLTGTLRWLTSSGNEKTGTLTRYNQTENDNAFMPEASITVCNSAQTVSVYGTAKITFSTSGITYVSEWKSTNSCWLKDISIDIFALYV